MDILPGTFYANPDSEEVGRVRAIMEREGSRLISEQPTLAEFYRKNPTATYSSMARQFLPVISEEFPKMAEAIIGYALKELIPRTELDELTRAKREKQLEAIFDGFDSDEFREHCKRAVKIRHELHGVDADAMTRGRGLIPWSKEERDYIMGEVNAGTAKDNETLAREVSERFGNERTAKNVYDMVRYQSKRKKK